MEAGAGRRKVVIIVLISVLVVVFLVLGAMNAFNNFLSPVSTGESILLIGLTFIFFLVFVAVLILLGRNLLKLYAEQRTSLMGTRLRWRMLWGAVIVSLIPIAFMFIFSYLLLNRALERWFSQNPNEMRNDSRSLSLELAQYTSANARSEAQSIAASLPADSAQTHSAEPTDALAPSDLAAVNRIFAQHEGTLQGGFAIVYRNAHPIASYHLPQHTSGAQVKAWLPENGGVDEDIEAVAKKPPPPPHAPTEFDPTILAAAQRTDLPVLSLGDTDYALGTATLQGRTVVAALPMPYGMSATMARFQSAVDNYWASYNQRRQVRAVFMQALLMLTIVALFASSWLGLHFARQVTKPVEALAEAMEAIAHGDYACRVAETATEELGELVRSFNHMAADLEGSRQAVESSNLQLSAANATLDARRRELETMLETIPNGVATLDPRSNIILANRALSEMLDPGGQTSFIGTSIEKIFPAETLEFVHHLLRRTHRMGSASGEMEMTVPATGATMHLLVTIALLESGSGPDRVHHGYVLVLENATELLRAQKQSAWKEVARRVAHEIKNPLTPIALSAEQIHRHVARLETTLTDANLTSPSIATIRKSSEIISTSVNSMRSLVDQFAALAQFPTSQPHPAALNPIVENSLAMFAGRLQNIRLTTRLAPNLPLVLADPEAMKRALGNLIDNAAEAMHESLLRELRITTNLLPSGMVELAVSDTGPGLTDEMRERLFLPYFSTKQRGTGLGLAIASKIIQEHGGSIRAEKNTPAGARFIIELPIAPTNTDSDHSTGTSTLEPRTSNLIPSS